MNGYGGSILRVNLSSGNSLDSLLLLSLPGILLAVVDLEHISYSKKFPNLRILLDRRIN